MMKGSTVESTRKTASVPFSGAQKAIRAAGKVARQGAGKGGGGATNAPGRPASGEPVADVKPDPGLADVRRMIQTAAYYIAEKRGFVVGYEQEDWLMAEREISRMLAD